MSECSICHETLDAFAHVKLVCNHEFHQKCIFKWISQKNECPFCKTKQFEPDPIRPEDLAMVNQFIENRANQIEAKKSKVIRWLGIVLQLIQFIWILSKNEHKTMVLDTRYDFELPMTGLKNQKYYPDMLAYYTSKLMDLS